MRLSTVSQERNGNWNQMRQSRCSGRASEQCQPLTAVKVSSRWIRFYDSQSKRDEHCSKRNIKSDLLGCLTTKVSWESKEGQKWRGGRRLHTHSIVQMYWDTGRRTRPRYHLRDCNAMAATFVAIERPAVGHEIILLVALFLPIKGVFMVIELLSLFFFYCLILALAWAKDQEQVCRMARHLRLEK